MSSFLQAYTALSSASSRSQVSAVLQSVTDALPSQIDVTNRKELVQTILDDLTNSGKKSRLSPKDALPALQAVKALGKDPAGSEVVATNANLSALLGLSHSLKDNTDASNEALRCIANALLLISDARQTFIEKQVGGAEACVELLEKSTSPERIFLVSRILFLCTASMVHAGEYIRTLVEAKPPGHPGNIVEIIGLRLDGLSKSILGSAKLAREAMTDLLKFIFNLLLHYPKLVESSELDTATNQNDETKVIGDSWSDRLDGILPPLLRTFNSLPPTFPGPLAPPMTHVIHSLITIPVTPSLHSKWFASSYRNSPRSSSSKSARDSPVSSPEITGKNLLAGGSSSNGGSPTLGPSSARDSKPGAFDRAMNALAAGRRSISRSSSPQPPPTVDVLLRAYDLLDVSLGHYLPGTIEPDDASVRERCRNEGNSLDDALVPLVLLMTKLCVADEPSRTRVREWILPEDLDRTSPLEGRPDFLGRCLRLLACVHHTRLKPSVGEMLFAICDSDASSLVAYVGYGNVAGFLFQKGIMTAPPRSANSTVPTTTASGAPINPVTGIVEAPHEPLEMSDEEKEREAEKLFVLFDRLEKSGAIPPSQNPIRKAAQEGRLG
ncbi:guanine nucleotide exchange factor [Amylocystis lapponica]|nr:guanine nucleotide exchange factor [Amylocystis lapponica]